MVVLEPGHEPFDDALVPVVSPEVGVAVGRLDLEDAFADLQNGNVKRSAAEIEDEDQLIVLLLEPVGEGGRGGFVDDAQHLESCDLAGLFGGLPLGVAEVGRHGDDGLSDRLAEEGLGIPLHLLQDAGGDLLAVVLLAVDLNRPVGAHMALDGSDCAVGVGDRLALGLVADQHFAIFGERHDRGGRALSFSVGDDARISAVEGGDHGVGGSKINTYCSSHGLGVLLVSGMGV